jgi:hypothetical protein
VPQAAFRQSVNRLAHLAVFVAILAAAPQAAAFTGGDERRSGDGPAALDLSPRGADGLRVDVPGLATFGIDCALEARSARGSAKCAGARAVDALAPGGRAAKPAAEGADAPQRLP